jgi:MFS family permease
MGIGMGLMLIPSLSLVSHYFRRQRAMAMGIVVSGRKLNFDMVILGSSIEILGSSIGAIIFPIILNNLFPKSDGFGWGVRYASSTPSTPLCPYEISEL